MVNLKEFFAEITSEISKFKKNMPRILHFVKNDEKEFISK